MVLDVDTQLRLTPLALRKARERSGLSQEEVAARCPISLPAIRSYEYLGHHPQYSYLLMLLEVYVLDLGGFYDLLTEIYFDQQRAEMRERLDRLESQVEALQKVSPMQVASNNSGESTP